MVRHRRVEHKATLYNMMLYDDCIACPDSLACYVCYSLLYATYKQIKIHITYIVGPTLCFFTAAFSYIKRAVANKTDRKEGPCRFSDIITINIRRAYSSTVRQSGAIFTNRWEVVAARCLRLPAPARTVCHRCVSVCIWPSVLRCNKPFIKCAMHSNANLPVEQRERLTAAVSF